MAEPHNMLPPISNVTNAANIPSMMMPNADPMRQQPPLAPPRVLPHPHPLDTMRAYRACLNCRNRKSKCDLDPNGGRPPCRRCQRENKECVLGESHRGGRRVRKKKPESEESAKSPTAPDTPGGTSSKGSESKPSPLSAQKPLPSPSTMGAYNNGLDPYGWRQNPPTSGAISTGTIHHSENTNLKVQSPHIDAQYRQRLGSTISIAGKSGSGLQEGIASADLQNPSDALEILAQVADRVEDGSTSGSERNLHATHFQRTMSRPGAGDASLSDYIYYKPVQDGLISPDTVYHLFRSFKEHFHPFFPVTPRSAFDPARLPWLSQHEPHLFSAILTVASKDDERVHQICYDHMQHLISMILAGAEANVEAVEAFLLLSQWVSHRPQASVAVGRGEEDRVAWMYIGTALRLGYYLGIDRASFKRENQEDPELYNRKRLVWAACYMCDRQVSVRAGKGFWARGLGPLSGLQAQNFPTLSPTHPGEEDLSYVFQANLELTQIFSNVHDILYSSKGHGWEEMLEGRYAKYLDDFRASIRNWNDTWIHLSCSPNLKTSLLLTYDYLRLYVNAFAYQATISRALTKARDSQHNPQLPQINATAPDARFIYEALDAAKSLLSNFNDYIKPEVLRCMPSSYYLFIIYSATFLYKARVTTTMTEDESRGVKTLIVGAIDKLQRSAPENGSGMGVRYARLLQLLWKRSPRKPHGTHGDVMHRQHTIEGRITSNPSLQNQNRNSNQNSNQSPALRQNPNSFELGNNNNNNNNNNNSTNPYTNSPSSQPHPPQNFSLYNHPTNGNGGVGSNSTTAAAGGGSIQPQGFSWLDLPAASNFATQNGYLEGLGSGSEGEVGSGNGLSPFDGGFGDGVAGGVGFSEFGGLGMLGGDEGGRMIF